MITIQNLLDEIKYGKDYIEESQTIATIQDCIDEDFNLLSVSKRVSDLLEDVELTDGYVKKILRATRNYKEFEDKVFEGVIPSKVYMKMKSDAIKEDVSDVIKMITENKKTYRDINKENISKAIATLKFGIKTLNEQSGMFSSSKLPKSTPLMESYISKELSYIEEIIPEQLNS